MNAHKRKKLMRFAAIEEKLAAAQQKPAAPAPAPVEVKSPEPEPKPIKSGFVEVEPPKAEPVSDAVIQEIKAEIIPAGKKKKSN
jgi:hypothetical protein